MSQQMFIPTGISRRDLRELKRYYRELAEQNQPEKPRAESKLPVSARSPLTLLLAPDIRMPAHVGTGLELAAANPFAVSDVPRVAGPVLGMELTSGCTPLQFHPWNLYREQVVSSPNILVKGSLGRGKSFIIKRLISLMSLYGVYSINTSDVKGEHGQLAQALGGDVFRVGAFGSDVRVNPLEATERHAGETEDEHRARLLSSRQLVLQLIAGLLGDGEPVSSMQKAILSWALDEVIRETNDHPTIRQVLAKIDSPALESARAGAFEPAAARQLLFLFDPLINGNLAGMFEDEGTIRFNPRSPYTVFDTYDMEKRGDLALAITQTVTSTWVRNTVSNKGAGRRYMVIREEGWRDMKTLQALEAHELQLKLSREFGITMVMIVHEDGDFETGGQKEKQLAQKLLRGYENQIIFYQNEATLKRSVESGTLTQGEADQVALLGKGEFLLKLGSRSFVVTGTPTSTDWERHVFDTDRAMREREDADAGQ